MNAPPLLFGGKSPVVAYLRHSMIVYHVLVFVDRLPIVQTYCFSGSIMAYDKCQWGIKLYNFTSNIIK